MNGNDNSHLVPVVHLESEHTLDTVLTPSYPLYFLCVYLDFDDGWIIIVYVMMEVRYAFYYAMFGRQTLHPIR
jgi:hypothetical protein